MKVRIKFSKEGPVKFIGHLDIMRYFQKAIRRADIDIAYSMGFNPHQIMSFASPLSVGHESSGEYFDIELNSLTDTEDIKNRLNDVMTEGIKIELAEGLRLQKMGIQFLTEDLVGQISLGVVTGIDPLFLSQHINQNRGGSFRAYVARNGAHFFSPLSF